MWPATSVLAPFGDRHPKGLAVPLSVANGAGAMLEAFLGFLNSLASLTSYFYRFLENVAFLTPWFYLGSVSWSFCFKTAQDGHKVVYPWGRLSGRGGGYVITSEQQYKLLRRHLKANAVIWLVLVGIASCIQLYLGP